MGFDAGTPFHPGELEAQRRLGDPARAQRDGQRRIQSRLGPEQAAFLGSLELIAAAARDPQGRPWSSLVWGGPGFVRGNGADALRLTLPRAPGATLATLVQDGDDVGLLGIDLATGDRVRVNGVAETGADDLRVQVRQTFRNCSRHIRRRSLVRLARSPRPRARRVGRLDAAAIRLVREADTFFVGTGFARSERDPRWGMDVSHRGGPPGFVLVESPRVLSFPDFAGNGHFNTLGNLAFESRAGLLFVDFVDGHWLQLTGHLAVSWRRRASDPADAAAPGRRLRFCIEEGLLVAFALPFRESGARMCERVKPDA